MRRWLPCYIIIVCSFVFGRRRRKTEGNIPTERIGHAQEGREEGGAVLAVPRRTRLTRFPETDLGLKL